MNGSPFKPDALRALQEVGKQALTVEELKCDVRYPAKVKSELDKVSHNAEVLGRIYEQILPDRGIGAAFGKTLVEVAEKLQESVQKGVASKQEPRHPRFFRFALNEVRLLSEVDRLLAEGDFERLEVTTNVTVGNTSTIRAKLKNVFLDHSIPALEAVWHFEPQGIRLSVSYRSPSSHQIKELEAHMDFHPRGRKDKWHDDSKKQAAIDFNGTHITPALKELGEDYHRSSYLDSVITSDSDFAVLREGRLKQVREKIEG